MTSAPSKALPKPLTSKPGISAATSIIISALITSANNPNVNTDNGAVRNHSTGRINTLTKPRAVADIKNVSGFVVLIPGTINTVTPRPMKVANRVINKIVILSFNCQMKGG